MKKAKTSTGAKIYVSDESRYEGDFFCRTCKPEDGDHYELTWAQFEPGAEYKCNGCGATLHEADGSLD